MANPLKIKSLPGIKRDGTRLEGDNYLDGQWVRFQRGFPRKMGGYLSVTSDLAERIYGLTSFSSGGLQYVHLGSANELQQRVINSLGVVTGSSDRTPASLSVDPNNLWIFDVFFDVAQGNVLVANVSPNLNDISNATTGVNSIFYGDVIGSGILVNSGQDPVDGGILTIGNYLIGYGSNGYVQWSEENDIVSATQDSANPTQQKIVAGRRIRGGGVPAGLLWSLDSLIQMTFNDPAGTLWDFDTVSEESSILSSRSVIEYDGIYYWIGVDRMLMYNGVVREVPNQMNMNFFFDNLNFEQRQKVFAYKVPRFGEIWWCFPRGSGTECTHAIVYNVREETWYDTALSEGGRTDGLYPKVYFKPFMTGVDETDTGFDLWQHETGKNSVRGPSIEPIPAYYETHEFSVVTGEPGQDKSLSLSVLEPDLLQDGNVTVTVRGRANARSAIVDSAPKTITEVVDEQLGVDKDNQIVRWKESRRLMSFRFDSNTLDGDFQIGEMLGHIQTDAGRMTQ